MLSRKARCRPDGGRFGGRRVQRAIRVLSRDVFDDLAVLDVHHHATAFHDDHIACNHDWPTRGRIPAGFDPSSFTAVSLDEWWMLGTARCFSRSGTCGAIVRTTDGGSEFAGIPSPPTGALGVSQLRFASALDGYAFDPQLWQTTNGGATWVEIGTKGKVVELEASDGEAYALVCAPGSANCGSTDVLRSRVGSHTWQKLSTPVPLGYGSQFAVSGPNLYLLGGSGRLVLQFSADKEPARRSLLCGPRGISERRC